MIPNASRGARSSRKKPTVPVANELVDTDSGTDEEEPPSKRPNHNPSPGKKGSANNKPGVSSGDDTDDDAPKDGGEKVMVHSLVRTHTHS